MPLDGSQDPDALVGTYCNAEVLSKHYVEVRVLSRGSIISTEGVAGRLNVVVDDTNTIVKSWMG